MAETISMPKLGFDMAEGTLVRWVKVEGDTVEKGNVLAEIETDKATVEVEANVSGVVLKHLVEQGSIVPVGTPIAVVGAAGEKVDAVAAAPAETAPAPAPSEPTPAAAVPAPGAPAGPAVTSASEPGNGRVKASPLARKMASDAGVNLTLVQGSGPGGRIVRKDVEAALSGAVAAPAATPAAPATVPATPPKPALAPVPVWAGEVHAPADERVAISKLRAAIGRRMVDSKQNFPHFYVTHNYDVASLMALRAQVNELVPEDQKLTVNDFIIKAVALTLRQFPNLNAAIQGNEVVRYGHVNIGVAVALEGGLMTIVAKDADQKPLRLISVEVREMATRARSGKVRPEDIEGSTFSISNMGMYDVENFFAIINPPEAAILAVGSAQKQPVVVGDEIKVGMRMKATISADHRVTDGAEAARFMQVLAQYIEQPMRLLI